ncbi:S-layer homology domain-containing protein [Paenibacillus aceris]|uniref:Fibronectin type 3 domain-containing protein n=1 Tax=Paenibacillus aceris TaxID=869555 RepID=A0ABS4HY40_9BACL|nr:S-layer homology domain-containing protein [Paenibacillus aceris]MBP1963552.1 fibronectin type 3 domain-containing protein [Paenibacillus aceris]NHW36815.1 hypothetical protein [Paenibacillus aceris]
MKRGGVIIFRRSYKSLIWMSIFLMLFSMLPPYLAAAAESDSNGGPQPATFSDIQSHWAYNEIMELSAANIVAGFEDGSFQPAGNVTREQFLKMLVELRKLPKNSSYVPFKDVEQGRWSVPYIAAGLTNGILFLTDFPDGFKPSLPITRYEMAVWIVRALQLPLQKEEKLLGAVNDQADIKRNRDLIEAALGTGIIQGYPDHTFKGGNNSTRAEAAVMLVRALHYSPGQLSTPPPEASRKIVEYKPEVKQSKSTSYSKRDDVTWVINDPDLKLDVGDVFVMPPNDQYFGGIAKKVESVSKENGALVVKTSVPKLKEVFSKLDVHTTEPINPKMLVPADPSIQIKTNDVTIQDTSVTLPCIPIVLNHANYEGIVLDAHMNFCNLGVTADIGLDIDVDWFDVDLDFYSKLVLTGDITTNVTVKADTGKGALTQPKLIPLTAPFYVPVFTGVFVKAMLYLKIDPNFRASLEIKFEDRFHLEEGFSYSLSHGFRPINNTTNTATLDVNSNVDASLAAGPDFQLTLTLLDIAYAGIELYPGIRAGYNRYYEQGRCDAIRVDAFLKLDVIAGYDVWVADDEVSLNLLDLNSPLYQMDIHCPPPPMPTNLKAQLISVRDQLGKYDEVILDRTDVQLSWDTVNDATSYNVKRSDVPGGPFKAKRSNLTATTFTDTTARKGTTYYYQVTAMNEHGESAPSRVLTVTIVELPPPPPQNLTAERSGSTVVLNWNKVGGFTTYNVKRAEGSSNAYETISSNINGTTFTDPAASFLKGFSYIVTAVDSSGESQSSNIAYVQKGDLGNITPVTPQVPVDRLIILPAPDNFDAHTDAGSGKVILTWNAVKGAAGYNVMRSNAANGTYQITGSKVSGTTFTDTTAAIGTTFYYKVTAVNNNGAESEAAPIKSATPSSGIR